MQLGLAKAHHKFHPEEKVAWPGARGAPQHVRFSFNICAMAEASDFKIGVQLGFVKAHNNIPPERKSGSYPWLGNSLIFWGYPCNFSESAEASDFRIGVQLFATAHHKIPYRKNVGVALC